MIILNGNTIYFIYGLLVGVFIFLGMFLIFVKKGLMTQRREDQMVQRLAEELDKRRE